MRPVSLPMRLRARPVCQLCDFIVQRPTGCRAFASASVLKAPAVRRLPARNHLVAPRNASRVITTTARQLQQVEADDGAAGSLSLSDRIAALKEKLAGAETKMQEIYNSSTIRGESALLDVLFELEEIARQAVAIRTGQPTQVKAQIRQSSAGAILSGLKSEEKPVPTKTKGMKFSLDALPRPSHLSQLAEDFIKHKKVFISANLLGLYVHLQRLLGRPRTIAEALYLFANKPVPVEGSSPPQYKKPSPKSHKSCVPADIADDALTAAIDAKDINLALSVVDHTYCAPAWRRQRQISKLALPTVLYSLAPFLIYYISAELSVYSNFLDPSLYKLYCIMGISTYVICTSTLGFVALTTWNDHHDRVVWRPGIPLFVRYMKEDERAALDRIACAWGFKEEWRRGEEEGDDWEGLRQWCLLRGMILDKSDLMPGMNPRR